MGNSSVSATLASINNPIKIYCVNYEVITCQTGEYFIEIDTSELNLKLIKYSKISPSDKFSLRMRPDEIEFCRHIHNNFRCFHVIEQIVCLSTRDYAELLSAKSEKFQFLRVDIIKQEMDADLKKIKNYLNILIEKTEFYDIFSFFDALKKDFIAGMIPSQICLVENIIKNNFSSESLLNYLEFNVEETRNSDNYQIFIEYLKMQSEIIHPSTGLRKRIRNTYSD